MKGISCCGDCGYYNWKKHKCTRCESKEPDPRTHFFNDCPLTDPVEVEPPIAPQIRSSEEYDGHGSWWYVCGACQQPIDKGDVYCRWCGKKVKWDD